MPEVNPISLNQDFTEQYISLRQKEGRIYSDEELRLLPIISKSNPLEKEWKIRERSSSHLTEYLSVKKTRLDLLEIGCGNGWLSNRLAEVKEIKVVGMDINGPELEQAKKVFAKPNLQFKYGRLGDADFGDQMFDIILFASSIQYFPSLPNIIRNCMSFLTVNGEIHIIDSHFYSKNEKVKARARSQEYFQSLGQPVMQQYYFHHELDDLGPFQYKILNKFQLKVEKLVGKGKTFPWICIKKQSC
jgi:ubiquinone/menaquinone biosynthesis C-methylase UbiE